MRTEEAILSNLLLNTDFAKKTIPHIETVYFSEKSDAILYEEISSFFLKYSALPSKEILKVQLVNKSGVSESDLEDSFTKLENLSVEPKNTDWLLTLAEKFCKDRAIYLSIMKSITILDGKDKQHTKEAIPKLLQDALSVSFDTSVGHAYLSDAEARYDFYTREESKIVLDIDMLNTITNGGLTRKSLNVLIAQSGGGKSLVMSHLAAGCLNRGYNVLYITLEMSEEKIAERIDANLLDIPIDRLKTLSKDIFCTKISNIAAKTRGRLYIKEYPTGGAHSGHFRGLIEELKNKQDFKPDIIFIDYLGICASARVKMGGSVNSYSYLKTISEELRGLAVENDVPVVSAGQVNRQAYSASDLDMADMAESMGPAMTADCLFGIVRTEELDQLKQLMFIQVKNRYSDPTVNKRFIVGVDLSKMKLLNLETGSPYDRNDTPKYTPPEKMTDIDLSNKLAKSKLNAAGFTF